MPLSYRLEPWPPQRLATNQTLQAVLECTKRTAALAHTPGWARLVPDTAVRRAQVAVEDINGDGALELVAVDLRGNCAAFSADGTELWERHLRSQLTQVGARCLPCSLW